LDIFQAGAGAPESMLRFRQVRDTPEVCGHALAELCLSAIGKSKNPPKYRLAIRCTIVQKRHSDPRCLPIPMRHMPAAIYVRFMLLEHPMKCISRQESLVSHALLQSIRDQQCVHSPWLSEPVVSHSLVSILTTS